MLNLFQSNEMSELARVYCDRNTARRDPFEPVTTIVQSFGIGQWLKLRLAETQGIAANIDCVLPATFLWRLYQTLIPETRGLDTSPFDRDHLQWRIMRLIADHPELSGAIQNYLAAANHRDLQLYQLAGEITSLFDEYLMYRPDWILDWQAESGDYPGHADWQSQLWRLVLADLPEHVGLHRAALHQRTVQALAASPSLPWQQLSIFGLSTMPPLQLDTFEKLAEHIDVDIYFQNPCQHYWGDIVSEKDKARRSIRSLLARQGELLDEDYLETGNPLLSSLGKQGREYLELLLGIDEVCTDELFVPDPAPTMLGFIHNDILEMTHGGAFGDEEPTRQNLRDSSIQLHCCHSRLREVEVLHDEILRAIKANPGIRLSDIIVMAPDISQYSPFIDSIFADSLDYRISDQTNLASGTLLNTILLLLRLPGSRLTGTDVMDLLEVPAVMRRFDLRIEDLELLSHWINTAEIRWEISKEAKTDRWDLPAEHQNTWYFGLNRLLLGFAMSPARGPWQNILPIEISPSDIELLGTLCHIIDRLTDFRQQLDVSRSMSQWQEVVTELVNEFFMPHDNEILDITQLFQEIESLAGAASAGGFEADVSSRLLVHALEKNLGSQASHASFISGGITFATLVPMRSIPFKMVCLLGINDGEYPRDIRPHSFDLIASETPRRGDRSKKLEDRFLFLEALQSAREIFYVSYIGKGIRDNQDRPPSAVLGEFRSYLDEVFESPPFTEHALQPFNALYYGDETRRSFSKTWYQALSSDDPPVDFLHSPLPEDPALACNDLSQLKQFMLHPGQYFLRNRLHVRLSQDEDQLKDVEPFTLDNLERYWIADEAMRELAAGRDIEVYRDRQLLSGRVLSGLPGRQQLDQELERARAIFDIVSPYLAEQPAPISRQFRLGNRAIQVSLNNIFGEHLVQYRAGRLSARHQLAFWIEHLAANLVQETESVFVHQGDKGNADKFELQAIDAARAEEELVRLLGFYEAGMLRAVFLPPEACRTYTSEITKGKDTAHAMNKVREAWERDMPGAEGKDREWQRLFEFPATFDDSFRDNALSIWQPILDRQKDD